MAPTGGGDVQGSARKDVVFGAARVYNYRRVRDKMEILA